MWKFEKAEATEVWLKRKQSEKWKNFRNKMLLNLNEKKTCHD